jgi:hypothetical protein
VFEREQLVFEFCSKCLIFRIKPCAHHKHGAPLQCSVNWYNIAHALLNCSLVYNLNCFTDFDCSAVSDYSHFEERDWLV